MDFFLFPRILSTRPSWLIADEFFACVLCFMFLAWLVWADAYWTLTFSIQVDRLLIFHARWGQPLARVTKLNKTDPCVTLCPYMAIMTSILTGTVKCFTTFFCTWQFALLQVTMERSTTLVWECFCSTLWRTYVLFITPVLLFLSRWRISFHHLCIVLSGLFYFENYSLLAIVAFAAVIAKIVYVKTS